MTMDKQFFSLKNFFTIKTPNIDNIVFKLHYKLTLSMLIAFSIVVTSKAYLGDPIDCISKDDIPNDLLDIFCWIHPTFSVIGAWKKQVGDEVAYPGIHKHVQGEERVFHTYYQWVCFVLFLQGLSFYVPRYIWRNIERHQVKDLLMEFDNPMVSAKKNKDKTDLLVGYLSDNRRNHRFYATSYICLEVLNFVNIMAQIFITDKLLGGEFTSYGTEVLKFTEWDYRLRYDPMIKVFPRVTKCTFFRFGSSGDVQKHDALCVVPINIVNEKIYIILWFWFIILAILSLLALVYRAALLISERARYLSLRIRCLRLDSKILKKVVGAIDRFDCVMLTFLCKNMDGGNFKTVMEEFASKINDEARVFHQVELTQYHDKKEC